jgi:hypothetical protein
MAFPNSAWETISARASLSFSFRNSAVERLIVIGFQPEQAVGSIFAQDASTLSAVDKIRALVNVFINGFPLQSCLACANILIDFVIGIGRAATFCKGDDQRSNCCADQNKVFPDAIKHSFDPS